MLVDVKLVKSKRGLPILCLDFDGVLHSFVSRWQGPRCIPDPPVPGAMQFLRAAVKEFDVCVFSSRGRYWGGRWAMRRWLKKWLTKEFGDVYYKVRFPRGKPPAHMSIDDRAVQFTGVFPSVQEIKDFRPWRVGENKKRQ